MPATTPKQKPFPETEQSNKREKNGDYVRPTFIRCDLNAEQKTEMAQWANARSADDLIDILNEAIAEGYALSVKEAEQGFQSSFMQTRKVAIGVPNAGKCLTTWASSPERVLWAIAYKHTQVLEKDWSRGNTETRIDW